MESTYALVVVLGTESVNDSGTCKKSDICDIPLTLEEVNVKGKMPIAYTVQTFI